MSFLRFLRKHLPILFLAGSAVCFAAPARAIDVPAPRPSGKAPLPFLRRYAEKPRTDIKVTRPPHRAAARSPASGRSQTPARKGKAPSRKTNAPARGAKPFHKAKPPLRGANPPIRRGKRPTKAPPRRSASRGHPLVRPPVVARPAPVAAAPTRVPVGVATPIAPARSPAQVAPAVRAPPYMSSPNVNIPMKVIPLHPPSKNGKEPDRTIRLDMTRPY